MVKLISKVSKAKATNNNRKITAVDIAIKLMSWNETNTTDIINHRAVSINPKNIFDETPLIR